MILIVGMNDANRELLVTDQQYNEFVSRHLELSPVVEDTDDIINAYIVVNPHGQLIDNSNTHYTVGGSLLDHGFAEELSNITFNLAAYQKRYRTAE